MTHTPPPSWAMDVRKLVNRAVAYEKAGKGSGARALWDVLCALRGPDISHMDNDISHLKLRTTERIRHIAVRNLTATVSFGYDGSGAEPEVDEMPRVTVPFNMRHFETHVRNARDALIALGYIPRAKEVPRAEEVEV